LSVWIRQVCTRVIATCNRAGTRLCIAEELRDLETQLRRYITEVPLAVSRNVLARWRSLLSFRTDFIPQVLPALPAEPKPAAYDEAAKPSSLNQLALLNENDAFFANCLSGRSSCIERLAEVARRVSLSRASLANAVQGRLHACGRTHRPLARMYRAPACARSRACAGAAGRAGRRTKCRVLRQASSNVCCDPATPGTITRT
jgi:hypothetical protein